MAPSAAPTVIPSDLASPAPSSGLQSQSSQSIIGIVFGIAMFLLAMFTVCQKAKIWQRCNAVLHTLKLPIPTWRPLELSDSAIQTLRTVHWRSCCPFGGEPRFAASPEQTGLGLMESPVENPCKICPDISIRRQHEEYSMPSLPEPAIIRHTEGV